MKAKSKLLLSACALTASLAVASTGTFAWFSSNSTPKVDAFEMNVMANAGVKVSIRDSKSNWSTPATKITADQVKEAIKADATKLTAVETADGIVFKTASFAGDTGTIVKTAVSVDKNSATGGYVSFDLRFTTGQSGLRLSSIPTANILSSDSSVTQQAAGVTWGDSITPDSKVGKSVAESARLSIVSDDAAKVVYGKADGEYKNGLDGLAWAIFKYESGLDGKTDLQASDVAQPETVNTTWATGTTTPVEIATLAQVGATNEYACEITVNLWLDGWDGDCFNAAMGQILKCELAFSGTAAA